MPVVRPLLSRPDEDFGQWLIEELIGLSEGESCIRSIRLWRDSDSTIEQENNSPYSFFRTEISIPTLPTNANRLEILHSNSSIDSSTSTSTCTGIGTSSSQVSAADNDEESYG